MIGKQLAHYRIVDLIGSGGMGVVYRARDERLGRDVAIKVLSVGAFADPQRRKRFRSEALTLSRLNHPNIATLHDFNTADGVDFLVMEYLHGETLESRLQKRPLSVAEIEWTGAQIIEAVAAAHLQHVVHRDLKPANILITDDSRVKVLDFGLAQLVEADVHSDDRTHEMLESRGMSGTLPYMAPEQLDGRGADERTDIHAVGIILFEMATGRRPFTGSAGDIARMIQSQPAPRPTEINEAVSPHLSEVVLRCLEKDPARRFQSARELLAAFRVAASGSSPSVVRPVTPRQTKRRSILFAAAAVVAIAAGSAYLVRRDEPAGEAPLPVKSVAILPFRTDTPDSGALGVGVADAIVTKISRTSPATIRPTSAVRRYATPDVDPLAAGRDLDVDAVLEGTLRRSGDRFRIGLNLVRVRDRTSVWAENFDLQTSDIFAVEDAIAGRILAALDVEMTSADRAALTKRFTSNSGARAAYTRAMALFDRRMGGHEKLRESILWFKKAIDADPNYALAHANLGYAYLWMGLFVEPNDPRWLGLAKESLRRAEEIDPAIPDVHIARHDLLWSATEGFQIGASLRELRLAQSLDPSRAHGELAVMLYHIGLRENAARALRRAMEIDPTSSANRYHYVEGFGLIGDTDEAVDAAKRFGAAPPLFALLSSGRLDEAEREIAKRLAEDRGSYPLAFAARAAAMKGDSAAALRLIDEALAVIDKASRSYHHITFEAALVHALLGDAARSVRYLRETDEYGMPNLPLFESHPHLQRIRSSPDFERFIRELRPRWQRYVDAATS